MRRLLKSKRHVYLNPEPVVLLLIYLILCTVTFMYRAFPITGDEPHYLVMANGIGKYATFEQTLPYQEEFQTRSIYSPGLAPEGEKPTPSNTHAVLGPNGLFSMHNVGLPLLIATSYKLGGTTLVKFTMILFSSFVVALSWIISGEFSTARRTRLMSVIAATIALPFIPASNQIYPDILAGVIALAAITTILKDDLTSKMRNAASLAAVIGLAYLPWLQIKFSACALVLVLSLCYQTFSRSKSLAKPVLYLAIFIGSIFLLAQYNYFAFGKFSGPYGDGALVFNKTSLIVLIGLHIDRFQGIFMQNPAFLVCPFFCIPFIQWNQFKALVVLVSYSSLVLPNALHPNWYGGYSFAGRFVLAGAIVALPLVLFGLIRMFSYLGRKSIYLFSLFCFIQAYFYAKYTFGSFNLYNQSGAFLGNYRSFYPSYFLKFLPALYDSNWAYTFAPNLVWLLIVAGLFLAGMNCILSRTISAKRITFFALLACALIIVGGIIENMPPQTYLAVNLPSKVGTLNNGVRTATQSANGAGFLTFGPYIELNAGTYKVTLNYEASSNRIDSTGIGQMDVYFAGVDRSLLTVDLIPTSQETSLDVIFSVPSDLALEPIEFRTYYNGYGTLSVHSLILEKEH